MRARAALVAIIVLAGCSSGDDDRLEGERIALRAPASAAEAGAGVVQRPIPPAVESASWTQTGGEAGRLGGHRVAPSTLSQAWSVDAGAEIRRGLRPSAPVVADGRIFVRDGADAVLAFDAGTGQRRWRADLTPQGERGAAGHGGGIAHSDGRLFVTSGFGEVLALSPETGERLWTHRAEAPFGAPPGAAAGLVVAVTRTGEALALSAEDGGVLWRSQSGLQRQGNLAGAAPAITQGVAAIPFGSGELQVLRAERGLRLWSGGLFSSGSAEGLGAFADVTSDPVVAAGPGGALVIAGNAGGAFAAFEGRTGRTVWQRDFGSLSPAWVAGDTLFVATTEPRLTRLDLLSGRTLWSVELAGFERPDRRRDPITYAGPVLAGGRVLITTSDGRLMAFDPQTGAELATLVVPGGSSTGPVVAGGTVYVLTDRGRLIAFR